MTRLHFLLAAAVAAACACAADREPGPVGRGPESNPQAIEAEPAGTLDPPFTADQIRDEWVEGFTVVLRRWAPAESRLERWTVVAADAEGADIEYAVLDPDGRVIGAPTVARSTWVELRDHASFPAATASREWIKRKTPLGTLEGWVYRVSEEGSSAVSELFFAASLPGAPVQMSTTEDGKTVFALEQIERSKPDRP
jgi:hypothetical protein